MFQKALDEIYLFEQTTTWKRDSVKRNPERFSRYRKRDTNRRGERPFGKKLRPAIAAAVDLGSGV